jgi:hypothetical protein
MDPFRSLIKNSKKKIDFPRFNEQSFHVVIVIYLLECPICFSDKINIMLSFLWLGYIDNKLFFILDTIDQVYYNYYNCQNIWRVFLLKFRVTSKTLFKIGQKFCF